MNDGRSISRSPCTESRHVARGQVLSRVAEAATAVRTLDTQTEWFDALADVFGLTLDDVDAAARTRLWQRVHTTRQAWLASQQ